MKASSSRDRRKPDSVDALIDRKLDQRIAPLTHAAPRYARPEALGITARMARRAAERGDYRVCRVGKYLLVDVSSFEAFLATREIRPPEHHAADTQSDPLRGVDPSIRAAFERAARGV
jgi:hypothetical protein